MRGSKKWCRRCSRRRTGQAVSRSIAEPLWRLLIEKSIEHEFSVFDG